MVGALIGTAVFVWDIYKWRAARANLRVSASPNMRFVNPLYGTEEKGNLIFVEAVNTGDKNTTITHFVAMNFTSWFSKLRGKAAEAVFIPIPGHQPLPHKLAPGERWTGMINQDDLRKKMDSAKQLYCGVYHTGGLRPCLDRVQFRPLKENES